MFSKKKTNDTENPITENTAEEQLNKELTDDANADTITEPVVEISAEEQLKLDNAALNDKYLRLFAEFDNFKRRTQKERVELLQTAGKDVIISMLPVLDDF